MDVNIQSCIIQNSSCSWWLIRGEFHVYVSRRCAPTVSQSVLSMERINGTKTNMYFANFMWVLTWFSTHFTVAAATSKKKKKKKRHANSWKLSPHQWSSLMSLIHAPLEKWFYNSFDFWIFYKMWSVCCCLGYDACTPNKQQVSVYGQSSPTVYDRFVHKPCTAEGDKIKTCFLGHV